MDDCAPDDSNGAVVELCLRGSYVAKLCRVRSKTADTCRAYMKDLALGLASTRPRHNPPLIAGIAEQQAMLYSRSSHHDYVDVLVCSCPVSPHACGTRW